MHILTLNHQDTSYRRTLRPGQTLLPYDNITSIRISFYSLRLAKSDVFTPRLWEYKWIVDGDPVIFEIVDLCPRHNDDLPSLETLSWADGVVLVYSITDRASFNFIKQVWNIFQEVKSSKEVPMVLLGNKGDMVHLRQVSSEEGDILAKDFDCNFREVAAADQVNEIAEAFHDLCRDVHVARRKNKTSLLDRVLGNKGGIRAYHRGKSDSALSKD